jgi:hypothetical protein
LAQLRYYLGIYLTDLRCWGEGLNRNLLNTSLERYCRPNDSVRLSKESPIMKRKIPFNLSSEDETVGCVTKMHSISLGLSETSVRRHVFHAAKKNGKKKSFNIVPDILCFSCVEVGNAVVYLVEALCYKTEGCGFHSRRGKLIFQFSYPSSRTMNLGSTEPLTEMSTRNLPGR